MEKWRKVVRLYAFSLLAHRQWGILHPSGSAPWTGLFPIKFPGQAFSVELNRYGGGGCYSWVIESPIDIYGIKWKDYDVNNNSGLGDDMFFIAIGK